MKIVYKVTVWTICDEIITDLWIIVISIRIIILLQKQISMKGKTGRGCCKSFCFCVVLKKNIIIEANILNKELKTKKGICKGNLH